MIWKSILKNLKNLNLEVAGGDLKARGSIPAILYSGLLVRKVKILNLGYPLDGSEYEFGEKKHAESSFL